MSDEPVTEIEWDSESERQLVIKSLKRAADLLSKDHLQESAVCTAVASLIER